MFLLPFTVLIEIQPNTSNTIANRFTRLENDLHKMEYKHVCHWPRQLRSPCIQPLHHEQHFEQGECNVHYQMQYLEQHGSCRWDLPDRKNFNWLEHLLYIGNTLPFAPVERRELTNVLQSYIHLSTFCEVVLQQK